MIQYAMACHKAIQNSSSVLRLRARTDFHILVQNTGRAHYQRQIVFFSWFYHDFMIQYAMACHKAVQNSSSVLRLRAHTDFHILAQNTGRAHYQRQIVFFQ